MDVNDLLNRITLLEYHQKLLLGLLSNPNSNFDRLIIEKGISEKEVNRFFSHCDKLSMKLEEQKAEGFVYFYPLFSEFLCDLPSRLKPEDVIPACLTQRLFEPLMLELKKYINS